MILRETITSDSTQYLKGKGKTELTILAAVEGAYEENSGWNEHVLKRDTVRALLLGHESKIKGLDQKVLTKHTPRSNLAPLTKRRVLV